MQCKQESTLKRGRCSPELSSVRSKSSQKVITGRFRLVLSPRS
jgi:hypothetical protein